MIINPDGVNMFSDEGYEWLTKGIKDKLREGVTRLGYHNIHPRSIAESLSIVTYLPPDYYNTLMRDLDNKYQHGISIAPIVDRGVEVGVRNLAHIFFRLVMDVGDGNPIDVLIKCIFKMGDTFIQDWYYRSNINCKVWDKINN